MEFTSGAAGQGRLIEALTFGSQAVLVGTYKEKKKAETILHLDELERLGDTFGVSTVFKVACPLRQISARTFLGKGKIAEIK